MTIQSFLVEAPGLRLVVDTCFGNDKPRDAIQGVSLKTTYLDDLAKAGFARESVDAVVCTHLHVDHVGWNTMLEGDAWVPTFPSARYLMARKEYEHWLQFDGEHVDHPAVMADSVQPIFDAGLEELVEATHRISPEVRLIPTHGHTPGHVSVAIESRGERAIITGDMIHHACQVARPEWTLTVDSDPEAVIATRTRFLAECADQPVLVIGTHFPEPTAGRVFSDGDGYRFEG